MKNEKSRSRSSMLSERNIITEYQNRLGEKNKVTLSFAGYCSGASEDHVINIAFIKFYCHIIISFPSFVLMIPHISPNINEHCTNNM